jgi:hypothetical protein
MRPHRILASFKGSQTGIDSHEFEAGTVAILSESLAKAAIEVGLAKPYVEPPKAETKRQAAEIEPRELAEGETLEEGEIPEGGTAEAGEPVNPADLRETKVVKPAETKPAKATAKKAKP